MNATSIAVHNARLVLPAQTVDSASLVIEDGRIARIATSPQPAAASESVIDLHGLTVFPGFIDVHIHGAVGVDTMNAAAPDLSRAATFLTQHGVTAWLPTLVPAAPEAYAQAIRAISETMATSLVGDSDTDNQDATHRLKSMLQARVLGVHYEGPFVNDQQCGALHREHFRTFKDIRDLDSLPVLDHDAAVHMITVAPEIDGGIALVAELTKRGWIVSMGHTRATAEVLDQALAAGARHMTHFMNAMTPLHHRAPGPVGWGLMHDKVSCDLIADGIHLDPSILKLILRCKTSAGISLISDAIAAAGLGDGEYEIWGEQINVKNGRTQNAKGSIAGSVITILDAVRLMSTLGFSERDLALMSSLNPARLLGIDRDCGSIEEGKRADLVVLDDEKNVRLTMIGGEIAFSAI
jgi:N-acetylglucosamine-6-phosphate deacetylase